MKEKDRKNPHEEELGFLGQRLLEINQEKRPEERDSSTLSLEEYLIRFSLYIVGDLQGYFLRLNHETGTRATKELDDLFNHLERAVVEGYQDWKNTCEDLLQLGDFTTSTVTFRETSKIPEGQDGVLSETPITLKKSPHTP